MLKGVTYNYTVSYYVGRHIPKCKMLHHIVRHYSTLYSTDTTLNCAVRCYASCYSDVMQCFKKL